MPWSEQHIANAARWIGDPVAFVREVLGAEPDDWQVTVLEGYAKHDRVAMKACKGPGKTTAMAWAGWHFLFCYPHSKVIGTSITGDNLRDGLWTELAKWQQRSDFLKDQFQWHAERIVHKEHSETWFASARTWPKEADKTQQANSMAGIHADYELFLLDEVSEYPDGVVAAAEGNLSSGKVLKLIAAGNPTRNSGPLYNMCTRDRSRYFVVEITGDPDSPKRAKRIDIDWAREQIKTYGRDSNYVRVNVLGQFPHGGLDNLIAADVASEAMARDILPVAYVHSPKIIGVDVARFGDDRSVIQKRQGLVAFRAKVFRELDTMALTGQVVDEVRSFEPDMVFVDAVGVGAGVCDRLKELGYTVMPVDSGARARNSAKYANKRVEMWAEMAEWLKVGCIPENPELLAELTAPTYRFKSSGQMELERKDEMKKRGIASPDLADALAFTFAEHVIAKDDRLRDRHMNRSVGHAVTEYEPMGAN